MKLKRIVIVVLILIGPSIFVSCTEKNTDIPENLVGKWATSDPLYVDRFIKMTKTTLIYGLGGDKKDIYFVSGIKKSLEGNNILYTIHCKNTDGYKITRSFFYDPENEGKIRFRHQEHIKWHKMKNTAF